MAAVVRFALLTWTLLWRELHGSTNISATSALVQWRGRYRQQLDGTSSFDWEGVQFRVQVTSSRVVTADLRIPPFVICRMQVFVNGSRSSTLLLNSSSALQTVVLAAGLDPTVSNEINVYNAVEPAIIRGALIQGFPHNDEVAAPTLVSVAADGTFVSPSTMKPIKIMTIGDGTASGFGAGGPPCMGPPIAWSDHSLTFTQRLCDVFGAECLGTIAWVGKGLIANAPGLSTLPTLSSDFYQVLGGESVSRDFDFNRPSRPDVIILALGAADLSGPQASNATFVDTFVTAYTAFALNLTRSFYSGYPTLFLCAGPHAAPAVSAAVLRVIATLRSSANVTAHFVDLTGVALDGCDSYPGSAGHAEIATRLQAAITAVMGWAPKMAGAGDDDSFSSVGTRYLAAFDATSVDRAALWATGREPVVPRERPRPSHLSGLQHASTAAAATRATATAATATSDTLTGNSETSNLYFTVRSDGSGDFTSIQVALDFCNASTSTGLSHVTLNVLGHFFERVVISADFSAGVSIVGNGTSPLDALLEFNQSNAENVSSTCRGIVRDGEVTCRAMWDSLPACD
jgi:hypothetical protein